MIGIVNYGSGNVQALDNIFRRLGVPCALVNDPAELANVDHCILPGVGAFDQCMDQLNRSGLREGLQRYAVEDRRPILGICVGMQLLARRSEEGAATGLGWIAGDVRRFDETRLRQATRLPHMGWNTVEPAPDDPLFAGVDLTPGFYFLHSYHVVCDDPSEVLAVTEYGGEFASAVRRDNVYGTQFHPEKSHAAGIQVLRNFSEI